MDFVANRVKKKKTQIEILPRLKSQKQHNTTHNIIKYMSIFQTNLQCSQS